LDLYFLINKLKVKRAISYKLSIKINRNYPVIREVTG